MKRPAAREGHRTGVSQLTLYTLLSASLSLTAACNDGRAAASSTTAAAAHVAAHDGAANAVATSTRENPGSDGRSAYATPLAAARAATRTPAPAYREAALVNRYAYIPVQCYAHTDDGQGHPVNSCYVCHTRSPAPNYVDDSELQTKRKFPGGAARNPWSNALSPALTRSPPLAKAELLAYVRHSNYFAADGSITLARTLAELPEAWDGDGDGHWNGFVPDAYFRFDARGFDLAPDNTHTGWRAVAYRPLPGAFLPTNGSLGDVLVRLDRALYERSDGQYDARIAETNFAIIEALIARRDVAIDPTDERELDADLDRDGTLGTARTVVFAADGVTTPMQYVGRARTLTQHGKLPIAPGLYPLGSEFLHSVRYLDPQRGRVAMAARMKELRYAKKVRWFSPKDLETHAERETLEQAESTTGALEVRWQFDRGVYNGQGWLLQAFIEADDGALRPETYEETLYCAGCHGGIGATVDSTFAFARKLTSPARGYFHASQRGLAGVRDAPTADGGSEYVRYLEHNRGGDEFRDNAELNRGTLDATGLPLPAAKRRVQANIEVLLMPSPERAVALDRAYLALVREQSYTHGREPWLAASQHVYDEVAVDSDTGLTPILPAQ
jgi:hypothetical protein